LTEQLYRTDYAHPVAALVGLAVATLAYGVGLRVMRRLP
jgi:hypothetical protein